MFEENRKLVNYLYQRGYVRSKDVFNAMLNTLRENFVWEGYKDLAYEDQPLPLGNTGQTISAPHMVAMMLEELKIERGNVVLEVGTGSGYNAACLSFLVGQEGRVVSVEINKELYEFARNNLSRVGAKNVEVVLGDGSLGYPPMLEQEIYDRIVVTAGTRSVPRYLVSQLRKKGIMLIPLGENYSQVLTRFVKNEDGSISRREICDVMFVPLVS